MSPRRTLAVQQLTAAVVVVLVLALAGGGRYPLAVDLGVYAAAAAMAATAVAQLRNGWQKGRHPADRPGAVTLEEAATEAADWVITARPADDHNGRTLTPEMVQREALMRSGLEVTRSDAAFALDSRLHFRGYGPDPALRSFAWEYGDLDERGDGPASRGRM